MKSLLPLLLAITVPVALSGAGFEGKVSMKVSGPKDAPAAMTFSLKEGLSRIDMLGAEGHNAGIIFDAAKQEMTILMLDQKMYITQALPNAAPTDSATGTTALAGTGGGNGLVGTGTKDKILGYDCDKYTLTAKDGTSEIWVTNRLGSFPGLGSPPSSGGPLGLGAASPAPQGWEAALEGKGIFPLRVITTAGGRETFRMEATAVEKQPIPAAAFYPPADFKNLGDMLRGMGLPGGIPGMPGGMKLPGSG